MMVKGLFKKNKIAVIGLISLLNCHVDRRLYAIPVDVYLQINIQNMHKKCFRGFI